MIPDYEKAASLAMETLIKNNINEAPISPLPILKRIQGILVLSFAELSELINMERGSLISLFGANQDAATFLISEKNKYIVAYNKKLPLCAVQWAIARELGHILLGHDGSRPEDIRMKESYFFAHHLLCPRPLVKAIQEKGIRITKEVTGSVTGIHERFLSSIKAEPGVYILPELNRAVRDHFTDYVDNYIEYQKYFTQDDQTDIFDFGSYMEGYQE